MDGFRYARLAVCAVTSFIHVSYSASKDTASLIDHLKDVEKACARNPAGPTPIVYRLDFGSEAFRQGHGNACHTQGLTAYLDNHPGVRVIAIPPKAQA